MLPHDANPQTLERPAEARNVIGNRVVDRRRITLIEAEGCRQCDIAKRLPLEIKLVDQAIDVVQAEYLNEDDMLTDFYLALMEMDENLQVLKKMMQEK